MKVYIRSIFLILLLTLIFSCSTHMSSIREGKNSELYIISEKEIFSLAYNSMMNIFPKAPIKELDGPIRGFLVTRTFGPDYYSTMLRVFPAEGNSPIGDRVFGYYFEVSGKGTYFDGPSKDKKLYNLFKEKLKKSAELVQATNVMKSDYKYERDRWKLEETTESSDQQVSIEERLKELNNLKDKGLITEEEYETKRQDLIDQL